MAKILKIKNCTDYVQAHWHSGYSVGLAINRSWVQILRGTKAAQQPWASCSHAYASVTKQYNLVPAKRRWRFAAGKVTAGLAESNGSLLPGGWLIVTCGLTACTPGSAPGPTLSNEYRKPFTFFTYMQPQPFYGNYTGKPVLSGTLS